MNKLIREIGVGKSATVSEWEWESAGGKRVAVKQYHRQLLTAYQHERIFQAATHWKSLKSSRLLAYLEVSANEMQIVMPLCERSAATRLAEGASKPRVVLETLRGVLEGLEFLHQNSMLHLNLKPSNVFYDTRDGSVRLSDGLLVPAFNPGTLPPPSNQKYLTPEHTSSHFGQMGPATDLYLAGFLALEMLAGSRFGSFFQGVGEKATDEDLAWFQWHSSPMLAPCAREINAECPGELDLVIQRLLSKNVDERVSSAAEALSMLPTELISGRREPERQVATAKPSVHEASIEHVKERPQTGIVLQVASGPWAGRMFGSNDNEMLLGFDGDCLFQFPTDAYPANAGKIRLLHSNDGWHAERVEGDLVFVNQQFLDDRLSLRSGDLLRLSPQGPDVQFTVQSGGLPIQQLAALFLPAANRKGAAAPAATARQAASAPGPQRSSIAAPSAPGAPAPRPTAAGAGASARNDQRWQMAPPDNAPRPAAPAAPAPRPQPAAAAPQGAAPRAASPAPAPAAQPARPQPAPANQAPGAPQPGLVMPGNAAGITAAAPSKGMSKNQKNLLVAVVGGIFVILLVIFFPTGSSKPKEAENQEGTAQGEGESTSDSSETTSNETSDSNAESASDSVTSK